MHRLSNRIFKKWATRCVLEASQWEYNWFITFTYDDDHLPKAEEMQDDKGNIYTDNGFWNGYLEPRHMTLFLKTLRERWKRWYDHDNIRFYYCGEYGDRFKRPHYHALMFNLPIEQQDLIFYKKTRDGNILYKCPKIEELWGKGYVVVAQLNWSTAAYTARYVMKKITGEESSEYYAKRGQTQEFVRMSRMPGIARQFYEDHKDEIYKTDEIILKVTGQKPGKIKVPSYYDRIYDIDYPSDMQRVKEIRKENALNAQKAKNASTSLSMYEQLRLEEDELRHKIKRLKRSNMETHPSNGIYARN